LFVIHSVDIPMNNLVSFAQMGDDSQLKEALWRLQQLQTQHDYITSKSQSQNQAYKHAEEQLEVGRPVGFVCTVITLNVLRRNMPRLFEICAEHWKNFAMRKRSPM
jgi:hypothetical protein